MDARGTGAGLDVTGGPAGAGRPDIEVRRDDPPVVVPDSSGRSGRTVVLVGAVVVALLVAALGALWLLRGGDDDVATAPAAGGQAAAPAALTVQVDPPVTAVAGQPATLVVHYTDGFGVFSGSTEDWGDGVGVGSAKTGSCSAPTRPGPVARSYRATHTWADPGTYPVAIEVTTYVCDGGSVVEEHARATVDVTVTAP